MTGGNRIRLQRILREVEGYLELEMPQAALELLNRIQEPGTFRGQQLYLTGEALRSLQRYRDAIAPLEQAADLQPSNLRVWMALGWCQKRLGRLDLAIEALERAEEVAPEEAVVPYNLACYWSLAGKKQQALSYLSRAIAMDPEFRERIHDESDFDPIRSDPEFRALSEIIV
ncbi:MAG TPA: tetratricopeptide repeat protein [Pirellulales bacterium]|nr:tetratricopeptide repeat protein [Pirellulales bacterium]